MKVSILRIRYSFSSKFLIIVFLCLLLPIIKVHGNTPLIVNYSTYLGGNGTEGHGNLYFNGSNRLIIVSETSSTDYPVLNSYQDRNKGERDIIISSLALDENSLTYSTYFGGDGDDFVSGSVMNSEKQIIIVGVTDSSDFPLIHPLSINSSGERDVFIVIFDLKIGNFTFSSLLGPASDYYGINVCTDSDDNIIISGATDSEDFYLYDAYQNSLMGGSDGFIMKISSDGQKILFSTLIGGLGDDSIKSVTTDNQDNIIFIGVTQSVDFPTINAYTPDKSESTWDVFLAKVSNDGQQLIFSTFHGGTRPRGPQSVICDSLNNIIITGETDSMEFPLIHALQSTYGGGSYDVFLSKFNSNGSKIDFSTYLGGLNSDTPISLHINSENYIFLTGCTGSAGFPNVNSYQTRKDGGTDGFLTLISANGQKIIFSSFFGGMSSDFVTDLIFLPEVNNSFIITGHLSSSDIPMINPYQNSYGGGQFDLFITKFSFELSLLLTNDVQIPAFELLTGISTLGLLIHLRKKEIY